MIRQTGRQAAGRFARASGSRQPKGIRATYFRVRRWQFALSEPRLRGCSPVGGDCTLARTLAMLSHARHDRKEQRTLLRDRLLRVL